MRAAQGQTGLTWPSAHPAQNRGRLADKRTAGPPPARGLKKELTPSFLASDGDSDESALACGQRPGLKQEDDPHVRIMKRRYSHRGPGCRGLLDSCRARGTQTGQLEASSGLGKGFICSGELPQQSLDPGESLAPSISLDHNESPPHPHLGTKG